MIQESKAFAQSCFWFTTLISKETHLNKALKALRRTNVHQVEIINMAQGNKTSRVLAWTFLNTDQQKHWIKTRW
jgi:23S rRNA (adenine1618-N6)-methyltransferase